MRVLVFKDIKNNRWTLWSEDRKNHLGYRKSLNLSNCIFIVDEDKRKKVLKTKKRFPHAWIIGTLNKPKQKNKAKSISYNPFTAKSFVKNKKAIYSSKEVFLDTQGKVWG